MRAINTDPQHRKRRKIGRNELCPCDSKKKYKKCCLNPAPTPSLMERMPKIEWSKWLPNRYDFFDFRPRPVLFLIPAFVMLLLIPFTTGAKVDLSLYLLLGVVVVISWCVQKQEDHSAAVRVKMLKEIKEDFATLKQDLDTYLEELS